MSGVALQRVLYVVTYTACRMLLCGHLGVLFLWALGTRRLCYV